MVGFVLSLLACHVAKVQSDQLARSRRQVLSSQVRQHFLLYQLLQLKILSLGFRVLGGLIEHVAHLAHYFFFYRCHFLLVKGDVLFHLEFFLAASESELHIAVLGFFFSHLQEIVYLCALTYFFEQLDQSLYLHIL